MKQMRSARSIYKLTSALALVLFLGACASGANGPGAPVQGTQDVADEQDEHAGMLLRYCRKMRQANDLYVAASMCQRAYTVKPTETAPLFELAEIYSQLGDTERKANAYRLALQVEPENIDALYGLAKTEMDMGRFEVAVAQLEHALQYETDDPRIYNAIGIAKDQLGEHEEAQILYRTGLTIDPGNVPLRNNLGLSLSMTGNHEESVEILRDIAKSPSAGSVGSRNLAKAAKGAEAARKEMAVKFDSDEPMELVMDEDMPVEDTMDLLTAQRLEREGFAMEPSFEMAKAQPEAEQMAAMSKPLPDDIAAVPGSGEATPADPMGIPPRPNGQIGSATGTLAQDEGAESGSEFAARMPDPKQQGADIGSDSQVPTPERLTRSLATDSSDAGMPAGEESGAMAKEAMTSPKSPSGISYTVQVGSYGSEKGAERGWKVLTGSAEELLASQPHTVAEAQIGEDQSTVYRLRAGDMAERAEADQLCGALKEKGIGCYVVRLPEAPAPMAKAAPVQAAPEPVMTAPAGTATPATESEG